MSKKFELTAETKDFFGIKLFRIRALMDFGDVAKGDLGGFVESEKNLDEHRDAWVYGNAQVYGNARVYGDAQVYGNAWVYGDAQVSGNARVYDDARVYGNARVYGPICCATRSDGYTFTVAPTPDGPRIIAGCRYFSFTEARDHWEKTRSGTMLGDESLAIVDHLERMAEIRGFMDPVKDE